MAARQESASRAKPKDIVDESQKIYGIIKKLLRWLWIPIALFTFKVVFWSVGNDGNEQSRVSKGQASPPSQCQPYSSRTANRCVITKTPIVLSTEEPTTAGEFEFCWLKPEHAILISTQVGINTFEYRSGDGAAFPIKYKMVRREALVNGRCPVNL